MMKQPHTSHLTPLIRIQSGAIVLAVVFVVAILGYRYVGGMNWTSALWMVVITISTVGYGEQSGLSPTMQLFTVGVIVIGMSASVYTFSGLFQWILEGELERTIGTRRMTREIESLTNHVIICGYGRIGESLAVELTKLKRPLVIVDRVQQVVDDARARGFLCVHGDATEEDLLVSLRIAHAHTLVAALPSDAECVFITLTARNLNPSLQIIARAELPSSQKKLHQAGANKVVMPTMIGARQMVRMITRPSTADLMEMVSESSFSGLELDEVQVSLGCRLIGRSVGETEAHRRHKLLVVAIKQADGKMVFNPESEHRFVAADVVMIMGHVDDIRRFRAENF